MNVFDLVTLYSPYVAAIILAQWYIVDNMDFKLFKLWDVFVYYNICTKHWFIQEQNKWLSKQALFKYNIYSTLYWLIISLLLNI